jgi:hypothetical protein
MILQVTEMFSEVRTILQKWYPQKRGWKIYDQNEWSGIRPHFVIERRIKEGVERSVCEVTAVKRIGQDNITQLNHYAESLSGEGATILEKILAVPGNTDTSGVPSDITIMTLKHFRID